MTNDTCLYEKDSYRILFNDDILMGNTAFLYRQVTTYLDNMPQYKRYPILTNIQPVRKNK